jgi:hypothetical protein
LNQYILDSPFLAPYSLLLPGPPVLEAVWLDRVARDLVKKEEISGKEVVELVGVKRAKI